jgi:hypothetical protein
MILLLGILIGLATGILFHHYRTREMRVGFDAACGRIEIADRKIETLQSALAKAQEVRSELGGRVEQPAVGAPIGQHFSQRVTTQLTAPRGA